MYFYIKKYLFTIGGVNCKKGTYWGVKSHFWKGYLIYTAQINILFILIINVLYLSMPQFLKDLKSWWHQQTSFVGSLVFSLMQTMTQIQLPFFVGLSIPVKMGNKRSVCTLFIKNIPNIYFIHYRLISFREFQAFEGLLCLPGSICTLPYCISAFWHQWDGSGLVSFGWF